MTTFGLTAFKDRINAAGYADKKLTCYADIKAVFDESFEETPFTEFEYAMYNSDRPINVDETNPDILWSMCGYYLVIGDKQQELATIEKLLKVDEVRGNFKMGVYYNYEFDKIDTDPAAVMTPEISDSIKKCKMYFNLAVEKSNAYTDAKNIKMKDKSITNLISLSILQIKHITDPIEKNAALQSAVELCERITDKSLYNYHICASVACLCYLSLVHICKQGDDADYNMVEFLYCNIFNLTTEGIAYGNTLCSNMYKSFIYTYKETDDLDNHTLYYMCLLRMKPLNDKGAALIQQELRAVDPLVNQIMVNDYRNSALYIEWFNNKLFSLDTFKVVERASVCSTNSVTL